MMHLLSVLGLILSTLGHTTSSQPPEQPLLDFNTRDTGAIPPSQDPWYRAPLGFEATAPGTILRIRPDPSNITKVAANCSSAYNILYRSTNAAYQPSWAVTTLLISSIADELNRTQSRSKLLSYQTPYNTANVDQSPSYTLSSEKIDPSQQLPSPLVDINNMLGRGWAVSIPDHEGPFAAFLAGPREGHAVLDSVRAALSSGHLPGGANGTSYAIWGYSGGSVATMFAAELQASYAPELSFAGASIGGLVTNVTESYDLQNMSPFTYLFPNFFLGITAEFPAARQYLISQLKTEGPYNATGFQAILHLSNSDAMARYAMQNVSEYFVSGRAILDAPELSHVIYNNGFPGYHGIPQMPMFAYKAIHDDFAKIQSSDEILERFCTVGVNILNQRNTVGDHITEVSNGQPRALEWLDNALSGTLSQKYPVSGCKTEDVTVNITQAAS
ncbi:secretory lipase-domain-containing protein [Apiospora arundinis]|uniref:Secretory lipase-domain-containing protein n=1 Tax=Apiospora arundinis TaxID=335852 RepID=A0ABR2I103_9PEZI